ncbi:hypothetical protein [Microcoleus sp. B4-C2]|uniref:hypothetical protein n=1 Tax=Microcoleus sp. B4-C2 TaxID=2818661 RepID=UPI002FD312CE
MAQASCLCKYLWHRHLACAKSLGGLEAHPTIIFVAQASCLCKEFGRARSPPHNNICGTGILPVQRVWGGLEAHPKIIFVAQASCL